MAVFPCFLLLALPLGLLVGAIILRGAVSLANRKSGKPVESSFHVIEDENDWSDYPVPGSTRDKIVEAIPMPGVGKGMGIMLSVLIVNAIVGFAMRMFIAEDQDIRGNRRDFFDDPEVISRLATLPVSFLVMAGLLGAMLPTRFGRACLVTLFYCLICIAIVFVIGVPLFAVAVAVGIR